MEQFKFMKIVVEAMENSHERSYNGGIYEINESEFIRQLLSALDVWNRLPDIEDSTRKTPWLREINERSENAYKTGFDEGKKAAEEEQDEQA